MAPSTIFTVQTSSRGEMLDITDRVEKVARDLKMRDGFLIVYVPHTTAGVTIQENADPDVKTDFLAKLDRLFPKDEAFYRHAEGNSDSHLKTSLVGTSATLIVERQKVLLGRWQGIYLCEFDGPRTRQVVVKAFGEMGETDR